MKTDTDNKYCVLLFKRETPWILFGGHRKTALIPPKKEQNQQQQQNNNGYNDYLIVS